ncbi:MULTISPECIES: transposase [unclassified Bradyrhizobium]|uniref:transposase n=1 Tax=unclassified Bradyrhizobium TaxID=2631580 RepID=UPI0035C6FE61
MPYKRQAVDLVASSGRSIGSVAKELGLRDSVLRRWVEQRGARLELTAATRRPTMQATLPSVDHAAESARLQQKKERLRMERDILNRSRSLLEHGHEIPLHRRSPRRLSGGAPVRRARRLAGRLLCLALAPGEPTICRQS